MARVKPLKQSSGQFEQLQSGDIIPIANLATGIPNGTLYIADNGTLQDPITANQAQVLKLISFRG